MKYLTCLLAALLLIACSDADIENSKSEGDTSHIRNVKQPKHRNPEFEASLQNNNQASSEQISENQNQNSISRNKSYSFKARSLVINEDDIVLGNKDANIVVIEYFSPTCFHCYSFMKNIYPKIKEKFIDTGRVAYVLREFIGNKQDLDAAILARCNTDTHTYEKIMLHLLEQQNSWAYDRKFREILTNIGSIAGISAEQYAKCIKDSKITETLIEHTRVPLKEPSFVGTPTFFVDGVHIADNYSFENLSKAIEEAEKNLN